MRRILLVATMASVALASCVKDESVDLTQQAKKLSFDTPVMNTQTRATNFGEIENSYPTNENFVVWAVRHTGNFTTWTAGSAFMSNVEVTYITDVNGWGNSTTDYYWPEDGDKLTFGAFSPTDVANVASYTDKGLQLSAFTVPATLASQYDLMYSDLAEDKTANETNGGYTGVPINFNHALSSVEFKIAKSSELEETATLTEIEVVGLANAGKFDQNIGGTAQWTDTSGSATYDVFTGSQVFTTTATRAHNDGADMLLLPQTLTNAAIVNITYTLNGQSYTRPVALKDLKDASSNLVSTWTMGTRYVYTISLDANVIYFAPKPADWNQTDITIAL